MGVHDKAAYPKVNRALDIPEDEPLFVIRAQDRLAVPAIARYENLARAAECSPEFISGLEETIKVFHQWQQDNQSRMKKPD